jgi:hypothetical protein
MPHPDEFTRRQFLANVARNCLGVCLFPMFGTTVAGAAPSAARPGAKAKHIIYLFMHGGMSHLDTFDPKPRSRAVMGPTTAIDTPVDGIQLGHYLPHTAKIIDRCAIIRSMNSTQGAHEQGQYMMHTSYSMRGTIRHPSLGSWVLKLGGRIHPELPGFVAVDTPADFTGGGFFGAKYAAAPIGRPEDGLQDCRRPADVNPDDFARRLELADRLNRDFHTRNPNTDVKDYEQLYQDAVKLMHSEDLKAFDLTQETQPTRDLYGPGRFAQGCLLARRLVEHGVRFVEVNLGGWDTHYDNFTGVAARCREFDQAFAALIRDLEARGKLHETLVVVATEFGRTPEIQPQNNNGRDHHPAAFSTLLAGGGIKGGAVHGETDRTANRVSRDPVTIPDFNATIAHALGLPHDLVIMSPTRRPFKIADKGIPITSLLTT